MNVAMLAAGAAAAASGSVRTDFNPPGPDDFILPDVLGRSGAHREFFLTKPVFLLLLGALIVIVFFVWSSRRAGIVPTRLQFAGEMAYGWVRNSVVRDVIGHKDFRPYVPYIVGLFFFLLVNNYFAMIPFVQFPSLALIGFVYALGALSWVVYNTVGIRRHGFAGYLKHQTVPAGVSGPVLGLIIPLEFMSNILVRPVTLCLRLWANLFAGHILLMLFATGGQYLIHESGSVLYVGAGVLALVLGFLVSFLELLVLGIQAYVFTLLTTDYISGALAEEH